MNATTVMTLALLGQCPCVSEYNPPRPDLVAVVEVAGPARNRRFGESLGSDACERDVIVLAANIGLPAGEKLTLRTSKYHGLGELAKVWFEYEPLRGFDTDHRHEDYSKCGLPEECTGQRFIVSIENDRLVDWHRPEEYAPPSLRRPIAPAALDAAAVHVVRVDGRREGTFALGDSEIEFDQTVTVVRTVAGEDRAVGSALRLRQTATLPELVTSGTPPQLRWFRVGSERRGPPRTFLPEYTVGAACHVHVDRNGRLLDWQFQTEPNVDEPPDLSQIAAMEKRLQHTPLATAADPIAFVHRD